MRLASLAIAAFFSFPWTAAAQVAAGTAAAPVPRQYLWEVSSLTNRVYLYGTVHAGKASFYPLGEPVQAALADAKVLAVEADITDEAAMAKSAGSMLLTPPDRLDKRIPAPVYERFRRQVERFRLPESQVVQLKPFIASSVLAFAEWGRLGYLPQYGVDRHLLTRARESKMIIVELEGAETQAALMNSLTDEESRQALEGTLAALENGLTREQITGMVNAWQSGDAGLLLEVARAYNESVPGARELEEKFIWSRHEAMADKIEAWLMQGRERVFVAVGALHLAGPRGLVEILAKRGFQVRQL
jgi:hypothetical protein